MSLSSLQPMTAKPRRLRRLIGLGLASVLLHVWMLYWADANISSTSSEQPAPKPVQAMLLPAEPPKPIVPLKEVPKPAVRPKRPRPVTPPPSAEPSSAPSNPNIVLPSEPPLTDPGSEVADAASKDIEKPAQETAGSDKPGKFAPPPSAELKYDVTKTSRDGEALYGYGKITWQFNGTNYAIQGDVGLKALFVNINYMTFSSEGEVDGSGVAPLIYREKRWRRSETNTHFHRERQQISFSASGNAYPRKGGEQDRASIIWQLAAIGRGEPERFVANTEIPIFVVGERDGDIWNIKVIGEENIEIGSDKTRTWHFLRLPPKGSYDNKLDIWLAPEQNWYPVRIRYTSFNGDVIDMSLNEIGAAQ